MPAPCCDKRLNALCEAVDCVLTQLRDVGQVDQRINGLVGSSNRT